MADLKNAFGILGALTNPTFTYDPKDIQIILHSATPDGQSFEHLVHGYPDGTFIQIDRSSEVFASPVQTTMDGRTQRLMKTFRNMFSITITLTQTSISNSQLQLMYLRDILTVTKGDATARQSISIKDQKSSMLIGPIPAWVESIPSVTYSNGIETRQWVIKAYSAGDEIDIRGNQAEFEFTGLLGAVAGGLTGVIGL